ncbi:hypothetical protein [Pyxidicoccus sp. MSG2]|uniref:hypothetical protein n=1 Tax=Pyxidicoccus sp. MSG2 TaxID=2996790 RepID=UPI002271442F|nr:hypothetical protein [Pyxidicoccus sp. MSG2]MCY1023356.1 hypothetical protein [Pyxidicoccus sp. MSG2]
MTTGTLGSEPEDDPPAPPTPPSRVRGGTLYVVEEEDAPEPPSGHRATRGLRPSTVLTALLVAAGLALPGVGAFLLRPEPVPAPETAGTGATGESPARLAAAPPNSAGMTGASPSLPASSPINSPGITGASPSPLAPGRTNVGGTTGDSRVPRNRPATSASPAPLAPPPARRQDLARLDTPRTGHASEMLPTHDFQEAELRALLDDPSQPAEERSAVALELIDGYIIRRRPRSLAREAERIFRMDLPRHLGRLPAAEAGWQWMNALYTLGQPEKVPEVGEAFLRRFPDSPLASAVDSLARTTAMRVATEQRDRQEQEASLRELEAKLSMERVRLESRGEPTTRVSWELAYARCDRPAHSRFHDVSAVTCRAFFDAWAPGETREERVAVRKAREAEIIALVGLRRYAAARERLAAFRAADPEGERQTIASNIVATIPSGEEE